MGGKLIHDLGLYGLTLSRTFSAQGSDNSFSANGAGSCPSIARLGPAQPREELTITCALPWASRSVAPQDGLGWKLLSFPLVS